MARRLYRAQDFIDAIPGTGGIITAIAANVGCTWITAKKWIESRPTVKAAYEDEREKVKDHVEAALIREAKKGDGWAIKFYLATQAKDRGYVKERTIRHRGDRKVKVEIQYINDWRGSENQAPLSPSGADSGKAASEEVQPA